MGVFLIENLGGRWVWELAILREGELGYKLDITTLGLGDEYGQGWSCVSNLMWDWDSETSVMQLLSSNGGIRDFYSR